MASAAASPRRVRETRRTRPSVVGLAHAGQTDPLELPGIDAVIFPAYLDGLAAESYHVPPALVRIGYIGALSARSALSALPLELLISAPPAEEAEALFLERLKLTRALLDLATEIQPIGPGRL